jgi:hypothetical protein
MTLEPPSPLHLAARVGASSRATMASSVSCAQADTARAASMAARPGCLGCWAEALGRKRGPTLWADFFVFVFLLNLQKFLYNSKIHRKWIKTQKNT